MDGPAIPRFCRPPATGKRDSTSENHVIDDVILVAILGTLTRIRVIRFVSVGHDENEILQGKARDIGVVRPIAKVAIAAVQEVSDWEFCAGRNRGRQQDAVRHIAIQ